jgi:hypothetical protein
VQSSLKSICGNCAVTLDKVFKELLTPGNIDPPKKLASLSIAEIVVAVPKSHIIAGREYWLLTATASHMRSLPSVDGLAIWIFNPVFSVCDTTITLHLNTLSTARFSVDFNCGTTVDMIAPSKPVAEQPFNFNRFRKSIAYSSSILVDMVDILDENNMVSLLYTDITMLVLPTSNVKTMVTSSVIKKPPKA